MSWRFCGVLLLGLLAGCSPDTGQLLVQIDSNLTTDRDPPVAGDVVLRAIWVEVCDGTCDSDGARTERVWAIGSGGGQFDLPLSFGVAPFEGDVSRRIELRVHAMRRRDPTAPDAELFQVSRRLGFSSGRSTPVPIFLSASCVGVACLTGFTCSASGECVPDDTPPELDGGVDAGHSDAGPSPLDGGPSAFSATCSGGPTTPLPDLGPRGAETFDIADRASVTAIATAGEDDLLLALRSPDELAVVRIDSGGRILWRRDIGADRLWLGGIFFLQVHGGSVYGAGILGEQWEFGEGVTVAAPDPSARADDSRRHGAVAFALDAASGVPLWAHSLKQPATTNGVGGLVVNDAGVFVGAHALGGTMTGFELDGANWSTALNGASRPRAWVARFSHAGALERILGENPVDGGVQDVALSAGPGDDVVFWIATNGSGGTTGASLIPSPPPRGQLLGARLRSTLADAVWVTTFSCGMGWSVDSVRAASAPARSWVTFGSGRSAGCSNLQVNRAGAPSSTLPIGFHRYWLGALAVDPSNGDALGAALHTVDIGAAGIAGAVHSADADERGLVVSGRVGPGMVDFGDGPRTVADTGASGGTDGFVFLLRADGATSFSFLSGAAEEGGLIDDRIGATVLRGDCVFAGAGVSMPHMRDGLMLPEGAVLMAFGP